MKTTLIALATASVLASAAASAANPAGAVRVDARIAPMIQVQYHENENRWDDRSASINDREARITERIQRGMSDGRITDREARRLQRELNAIESKERAFQSDGRLTRRETDELNRDLNRLADHVRQQVRDEQRH